MLLLLLLLSYSWWLQVELYSASWGSQPWLVQSQQELNYEAGLFMRKIKEPPYFRLTAPVETPLLLCLSDWNLYCAILRAHFQHGQVGREQEVCHEMNGLAANVNCARYFKESKQAGAIARRERERRRRRVLVEQQREQVWLPLVSCKEGLHASVAGRVCLLFVGEGVKA